MFDNKAELEGKVSEANWKLTELKVFMAKHTLERLIQKTQEFAPNETDFDVAIYIEGPHPNNGHSLIAVEDELADIMRDNPVMVDAMRDSIEFDTKDRPDEFHAAARAVVNECFQDFRAEWERSSHNSPRI